MVPWVGLLFVIVPFSDHTHLHLDLEQTGERRYMKANVLQPRKLQLSKSIVHEIKFGDKAVM